jgi:WD40 repeat protein
VGPRAGRELLTFHTYTRASRGLAFSPDGRHLAAASEFGRIEVFDARSAWEPLTLRAFAMSVDSVRFSPDGRRVAKGGYDGTVRVWDAGTGLELLRLNDHRGTVIPCLDLRRCILHLCRPDPQIHVATAQRHGPLTAGRVTAQRWRSRLYRHGCNPSSTFAGSIFRYYRVSASESRTGQR